MHEPQRAQLGEAFGVELGLEAGVELIQGLMVRQPGRAGYLVRYTTLDDVVRELRQADQLGTVRNKLAHQRPHAMIADEVGYMRLEHADANRFFQRSTAATPARR